MDQGMSKFWGCFLLLVVAGLEVKGDAGVLIVGGEPAKRNEFPYQVGIQRNGRHVCGGAIIDGNNIVTAAHCVQLGSILEYRIIAGDHSLLEDDGTEQVRNISSVLLHPEYDAWTVFNDIAIVRVTEPFTTSEVVNTIHLAEARHTAEGIGLVTGWGYTGDSEKLSDILQKVGVPLVSDQVCRAAFGETEIADSMLCAGFPDGGRDVCRGDTGAPLICYDQSPPYLCGIYSWQHSNCGEPNYPSVYTEVSHFTDWILRNAL